MSRKKFGEILVEQQCITETQLDAALLRQQGTKKPLGKILEEMDIILEEDIARALSKQFGFPFAKQLARHTFPQTLLNKIDPQTALAHLVFPLKLEGKTLYLAMSNPLNMALQSELSFKLGLRISPCVSTPLDIKKAIEKFYKISVSAPKDRQRWDILLVDPHEASMNVAETALIKEGYRVHKAGNGAEGLKSATQLHPDVIVTEIVMPRMNGYELFKALQNNPDLADIPVIALTGKSTAEDEYHILDLGFYDFIPKPINPIRLQARIRRANRRHQHPKPH